MLTDINTYLAAHAVAGLGWVNPTLYTLFNNAQTYAPYHDTTSGNNDVDFGGTAYAGDYPATTCYDLTTGVGSPDAWNLARDVQGGVQTGGGGSCHVNTVTTTQLITNGGFESGATGWTQYSSGGYPIIGNIGTAHAGSQLAFACEYPDCDDRIAQTITIPASGTFTKATLSFWVNTQSLFPVFDANPPCVDHLYATLASTDGTVVSGGQVLNSCVGANVFGYQYETFDVTSLLQGHTGQQLTLMLRGTTTNEAASPQFITGWFIDDVSLTVS